MRKLLWAGLILGLMCGIIGVYPESWSIMECGSNEWLSLTTDEKVILVSGIIMGAFGLREWIADRNIEVERHLPSRQIRDYVVAVEWIYERDELKDIPVWFIVLNVEATLTERRKYGR